MDYKLIRSSRRTLCVQVNNGEVIVRSPKFLPEFVIERFVNEKESWINKLLSKTAAKNDLKANEIYFSGKRMKISFASSELVNESTIYLKSLGETKLERKKALEKFLKKQTILEVKKYLMKFDFIKYKSLKFSHYISKWGSCSSNDDLTFNIKLAMCPSEVVEYVVVHELCHTKIKNHSQLFWDEVARFLPDYKRRRKWLREHRWYI